MELYNLKSEKTVQAMGSTSVGRDLGVNQNTLHNWKKAYLEDSRNCFPGNGKVTEYEAEVRRLKQELALVKEERDILKKAVGIFSEPRR